MQRDVSIREARPGAVTTLVGLGSNLGDRAANIIRALEMLDAVPGCHVVATSGLYESTPVDAEGGDFLNAAAAVTTSIGPADLLAAVKEIERALGRTGSSHDARPVDIDILFFGEHRVVLPDLVIPHPRWRSRRFVLVPLAEICGGAVDPETGETLAGTIGNLVLEDPEIRLVRRSGWFRKGRRAGRRTTVKNS